MRDSIELSTRGTSEFMPFVEIERFAIKDEEDLELMPGWNWFSPPAMVIVKFAEGT